MKKFSLVFLFLTTLFLTACTMASNNTIQNQNNKSQYNYGEIVTYERDKALEFPDFSLKYTGERKEEVPEYAQGYFIYYDFEISKDDKSDIVSWNSGTGSIGPKYFNFNDQDYVLEKGASILQEKVLQNDEIVIWRKNDYLKRQEANN